MVIELGEERNKNEKTHLNDCVFDGDCVIEGDCDVRGTLRIYGTVTVTEKIDRVVYNDINVKNLSFFQKLKVLFNL